RLGVVEDRTQLREVSGPKQVLAIRDRLSRQQCQRLGIDLHHPLALEAGGRDVVSAELPIGRLVLAQREHLAEEEITHRGNLRSPGRAYPAAQMSRRNTRLPAGVKREWLLLAKAVESDDFARRAARDLRLGLGRTARGGGLCRGCPRGFPVRLLELQPELHRGIGKGGDGGERYREPCR